MRACTEYVCMWKTVFLLNSMLQNTGKGSFAVAVVVVVKAIELKSATRLRELSLRLPHTSVYTIYIQIYVYMNFMSLQSASGVFGVFVCNAERYPQSKTWTGARTRPSLDPIPRTIYYWMECIGSNTYIGVYFLHQQIKHSAEVVVSVMCPRTQRVSSMLSGVLQSDGVRARMIWSTNKEYVHYSDDTRVNVCCEVV